MIQGLIICRFDLVKEVRKSCSGEVTLELRYRIEVNSGKRRGRIFQIDIFLDFASADEFFL